MPNTKTDFHLQLFCQVRNSESAKGRTAALAWEVTLLTLDTRPGGTSLGHGRMAGSADLLQEGPAAPHTLLVDSLKVHVVAIIGIFNDKLFLWIIAPE